MEPHKADAEKRIKDKDNEWHQGLSNIENSSKMHLHRIQNEYDTKTKALEENIACSRVNKMPYNKTTEGWRTSTSLLPGITTQAYLERNLEKEVERKAGVYRVDLTLQGRLSIGNIYIKTLFCSAERHQKCAKILSEC
jgi:hypothetical protein